MFYIYRNVSIHRYIGCLHEIEIQILKKYGYLIGWKNRVDTKQLTTVNWDFLFDVQYLRSSLHKYYEKVWTNKLNICAL